MATDYKALGKRISNARKQAGITQEALGEQLNMTRKHIQPDGGFFCEIVPTDVVTLISYMVAR